MAAPEDEKVTTTETGDGAPAAPETALDAPQSASVDEQYVGDPNRYVDAEATVDKAGEATVLVGEFAGSIIKVDVRTRDGLVEVDSFDATEINAGAASVTARSKTLTTGKATLRLAIPKD